MWYQQITVGEFPHSDISGSMFAYNSPKHFVVCHVLHQLLMPRHSPYALINLTTINCFPNWWVFEILMQFSWTENCYSNVIFISLINITHYLVFKEQNLRENNLSKPSKISISSQLKPFDSRPIPEGFIRLFFYKFLLHRKEVIHPHLPVGIPCYDLTPVIGPAFDGSLLERLCHRLRALPTPMVWRAVCTMPENVFTAT